MGKKPTTDPEAATPLDPRAVAAVTRVFDAAAQAAAQMPGTADPVAVVRDQLAALDAPGLGDALPRCRLAFQALEKLFQGIRAEQAQDHDKALDHFQPAKQGFRKAGCEELRSLTLAWELTAKAPAAGKASRLDELLDLLDKVPDQIRAAGRFGEAFEWLSDHTRAIALVTRSNQASGKGDFETGRALMEEAAGLRRKIAERYHPFAPEYAAVQGPNQLHKLMHTVNKAFDDFTVFRLDHLLAAEAEIRTDAARVPELLAGGGPGAAPGVNLADGLLELLDVLFRLAAVLRAVLAGVYDPKAVDYDGLRQAARRAGDHFARLGTRGVDSQRASERLAHQIDNLQRLAAAPAARAEQPGPPHEAVARASFSKFEEAVLQSLTAPQKQLGLWMAVTFVVAALSAAVVLAGCVAVLFGNTPLDSVTGVGTAIASFFTAVMFWMFSRLRAEVARSRERLLEKFDEARAQLFPGAAHTAAPPRDRPKPAEKGKGDKKEWH
jgi:hypothetical protein